MKPIQIGVIGTGLMWEKQHYPVLVNLKKDYTIKALCVRNEVRQRFWKEKEIEARIYDKYEDLLCDSEVEAVVVCVPIELNALVVKAALKAGKDVFAEKPLAVTLQEGKEIVQLQKSMNKRVYMTEQLVYGSQFEKLRQLIDSEVVGKPIFFEKVSHFLLDAQEHDADGFGKVDWRVNPKFPLGTIFDGGAHDIAIITLLFGMPETILAHGIKLRSDMGEYDHILTTMEFDNGLSGTYSHSGMLHHTSNRFVIHCENGIISEENDMLKIEKNDNSVELLETEPINRHLAMWKELAYLYQKGENGKFSVELASENIKIFTAIEKSINKKNMIVLEEI